MLSLGQLYTDDNADDNDATNNDDTNDNDNDTQWTNHDCIDSLACMPNKPKIMRLKFSRQVKSHTMQPESQYMKHDTSLPPGRLDEINKVDEVYFSI